MNDEDNQYVVTVDVGFIYAPYISALNAKTWAEQIREEAERKLKAKIEELL